MPKCPVYTKTLKSYENTCKPDEVRTFPAETQKQEKKPQTKMFIFATFYGKTDSCPCVVYGSRTIRGYIYAGYTFVSLCLQHCGRMDEKTGFCVFLLAQHLPQHMWSKIILDKSRKMW